MSTASRSPAFAFSVLPAAVRQPLEFCELDRSLLTPAPRVIGAREYYIVMHILSKS